LNFDIRVKFGEVEFTGKQENDGADRGEPAVATRLALGRLKQSVDRFQKAVGLARLRPGDDLNMLTLYLTDLVDCSLS
jgi:hypothetical protein